MEIIGKLPSDISSKIFMFLSHPTADILKTEITSFQETYTEPKQEVTYDSDDSDESDDESDVPISSFSSREVKFKMHCLEYGFKHLNGTCDFCCLNGRRIHPVFSLRQ